MEYKYIRFMWLQCSREEFEVVRKKKCKLKFHPVSVVSDGKRVSSCFSVLLGEEKRFPDTYRKTDHLKKSTNDLDKVR